MKKFVVILIVLVAVILIIYRAHVVMEKNRLIETRLEKTITPVEVELVKRGDLSLSLNLMGDVKGVEEADIFPKASGKLVEMKVKEGDPVNKDQVLAIVDRDVEGLKYQPLEVTSSLSGTVGKVYLDAGAEVTPPSPAPSMGTALVQVINMDKVKVVVYAVEEELKDLRLGQKTEIKVDAYPDRTFSGNITLISPVVNQLSRTASVEITLANPDHLLKPGMYAQVKVSLGEKKNIILIPSYAVLQQELVKKVFVVNQGKAVSQTVASGVTQNGWVEITSGLAENDSLIVSGQNLVKANEPVKVITASGSEEKGGER
jgi:multidrug efflux pump subunit AcrA (membrane-fusion protein)